jgi:AraC family transcriptional regulator
VLSDLRSLSVDARQLILPKPSLPTTATVNSAAYEHHHGESYDWTGLKRRIPFVLLQHTISGRGFLRYEHRTIELGPGKTMLLQFPHDNRYWLAEGEEWEFFWIALSGSEVLELWKRMLLKVGPVHCLAQTEVDALAAKLVDILHLQDIRPQRLAHEAKAICALLSDALLGERLPELAGHQSQIATDLQLATDLLLNHEGGAVPIAELAKSLGYSRHHFSRVFKRQTGQTPVEYRDEQRLRHACDLLWRTSHKIKIIAQACGYDDPNYFSKAFRKHFGVSPLDYRARRDGR